MCMLPPMRLKSDSRRIKWAQENIDALLRQRAGIDRRISEFKAFVAMLKESDVVVQNVSLSEVTKPPYKATVTFQKVLYTPGIRTERRRQTYVAQIDFTLQDRVPNEFVRVNPLGVQISYFRIDQAFEEPGR